VGLALVVEQGPSFDQHLGLGQRAEPFPVERLVAQQAVEAIDEVFLPGRIDCCQ